MGPYLAPRLPTSRSVYDATEGSQMGQSGDEKGKGADLTHPS